VQNKEGERQAGEAKRKSCTAAFKAKLGLEARREVKTINELGQAYGVHPAQVRAGRAVEASDPGAGGDVVLQRRGPNKAQGPGDEDQLCNEIDRLKVGWIG